MPSAAQRIHGAIGGEGIWAAAPQVHEVTDDMPVEVVEGVPEPGHRYPVIMGDYASGAGPAGPQRSCPALPLAKPSVVRQGRPGAGRDRPRVGPDPARGTDPEYGKAQALPRPPSCPSRCPDRRRPQHLYSCGHRTADEVRAAADRWLWPAWPRS